MSSRLVSSFNDDAHIVKKSPLFPSVRLLIMTLVLLGNFFDNAGFLLLNFTLVCMVNSTAVSMLEAPNLTLYTQHSRLFKFTVPRHNKHQDCGEIGKRHSIDASSYMGDLVWTHETQANVIAGYSWGMVLFTIPAGLVMHKTQSTKGVFLFATVISSVSILLTPAIAYLPAGDWFLFIARMLLGLTGGLTWPLTMAAAARWVPEREMGTMIAFASCGLSFAGTFTDSLAGAFCSLSPHGWTYAYYMWGGLNFLLVGVVAVLYNNDPIQSQLISPGELTDILAHRSVKVTREVVESASIPYTKILMSPPFWAILMSNAAAGWTMYFLADFMPTYIKEVLRFEAISNGLFTALPYFLEIFSLLAFGVLSDHATIFHDESSDSCFQRFSLTASVKFFEALALGGSTLAFLMISFLDCTVPYVAIVCFCLCTVFAAAGIVGYTRSTYLIGPEFAGMTASVGETVQSLSSVAVPYAVAAMTVGQTVAGWQHAMLSASAISFVCMVFFLMFGSGEIQPWAKISLLEDADQTKLEVDDGRSSPAVDHQ